MIRLSRRWMVALTAGCMVAAANAQHAKTVERETAVETDVQSVVLPSRPDSALVVTCAGCTPLSLLASSATVYRLRRQQVSLDEFRKAIAGKQANMTVVYDTRTRELRRVSAGIDAPALPRPASQSK